MKIQRVFIVLISIAIIFSMVIYTTGVAQFFSLYKKEIYGEHFVISEPRLRKSFGIFTKESYIYDATFYGDWSGYVASLMKCQNVDCSKATNVKEWYLSKNYSLSVDSDGENVYFLWLRDAYTGEVIKSVSDKIVNQQSEISFPDEKHVVFKVSKEK